jgi:3-oxoadipate enol-lactonase
MPFLARDGSQLYYETHGVGPALVFAHGLGGGHLSWWQQVPHFRDRYTCVTFDHRGFGLSRDAPGGPGPDAFVDDLAALVEHLGVPDVRLVAQSMGGWACLGYALHHPGRVRALVMASTTGTLDDPEILRLFRAHGAARPEAALVARGIHPACGERMAREQPALHFLYREVDALSHNLDKDAARRKLIAMRTTPRGAVAALRAPLLCIAGEEDVVIPAAAVAVLASIVPDARLARVPEAGHSVYWERPETFNRLVDDFLRDADGGARPA